MVDGWSLMAHHGRRWPLGADDASCAKRLHLEQQEHGMAAGLAGAIAGLQL
jgi:hypothetical protein